MSVGLRRPRTSLDLIAAAGVTTDAAVVDIGGGASRLIDALLDRRFQDVTVLDLSAQALATTKARLGSRASKVHWLIADVTKWHPPQAYDVWHDRAVFHFLTSDEDRAIYAERVSGAVRPNGHVIGTFAPDGPERCSGLPVMRHDSTSLGDMLGGTFKLIECRRQDHRTPTGAIQHFQFSRFSGLNRSVRSPIRGASGNTHREQMTSAVASIADIGGHDRNVRNEPFAQTLARFQL
jgi:SAM-dependent methyltransferase